MTSMQGPDVLPNLPAGYPIAGLTAVLALVWWRVARIEKAIADIQKDLKEKLYPLYWGRVLPYGGKPPQPEGETK